jgi:hypothetical protein
LSSLAAMAPGLTVYGLVPEHAPRLVKDPKYKLLRARSILSCRHPRLLKIPHHQVHNPLPTAQGHLLSTLPLYLHPHRSHPIHLRRLWKLSSVRHLNLSCLSCRFPHRLHHQYEQKLNQHHGRNQSCPILIPLANPRQIRRSGKRTIPMHRLFSNVLNRKICPPNRHLHMLSSSIAPLKKLEAKQRCRKYAHG